jgi:hypothetical protein
MTADAIRWTLVIMGLAIIALTFVPWRRLRRPGSRASARVVLNVVAPAPGHQTLQGMRITNTRIIVDGTERVRPYISNEDMAKTVLVKDRTVVISDIPKDMRALNVIRGRVFEDCTVVGPAVVYFGEGTFVKGFDFEDSGNVENVLWPVKASKGRYEKVGAIGFESCQFINCHFTGVGIAGPRDLLDRLKKDIKAAQKDDQPKKSQ